MYVLTNGEKRHYRMGFGNWGTWRFYPHSTASVFPSRKGSMGLYGFTREVRNKRKKHDG